VTKYDAAVVSYLMSQKSRVYAEVPVEVKPFVSAMWGTLVALFNYALPVMSEAFFAALEDEIGDNLANVLVGIVENANPAVVTPAPVVPDPAAAVSAPAPSVAPVVSAATVIGGSPVV
jgi:hypothetical protein